MQYVLGNMLNGGGGLNPDGLSLDLQFAADKTLTARKGPTPVFSRASTATFVGSNGLIQTAAAFAARFDHDPVTLASRGLLIEESRTNAFQHSSNFKDTTSSNYWANQTATTITVDQIASPDGGVNADLLSTSTSSFDCFTRRSNFWAGSTQYTYSIFVKRGPSNYRYVGLYIGAGATAAQFPYFDFDNPTTVQIPTITSGTINSTRVDAYPNGWYRVIITFTTAATPITLFGGVYISASNGVIQESNTAGNNCYIWGIQSELGSFPTSYIPTTTASVVRSADVCSITGSDFTGFTKLGEGSVVVHGDSYQGTTPAFCQFSNNTNGARSFNFQRNSSTGALEHSDSGAGLMTVSASPSFPVKFGAARNQTVGIKLFYNGVAGASSVFTTNAPQTRMLIGNSGIGLPLNGCIRSIKHFKKRLSDEKMQILTAP
jgi:hypothetical protein